MTKKITDFYLSIETVVNGLIALVVSIFMSAVTQLAPIAAPIPPAFSVYTAMRVGLAVPEYIAIVAAISIEVTGIFSARTSIRASQWNATRLKSEPEAPLTLSIVMATAFFVVVMILSFTIELWPSLVVWVYPGFVLVSVTVYVNMAIAMSLNSWENEKQTAKSERKQTAKGKSFAALQNDAAKPQSAPAKQNAVLQHSQQNNAANRNEPASLTPEGEVGSKKSRIAARQNEVSQLLLDGKKTSEIAGLLRVSPDTIRRDINQLNGKVEA